MSFESSKFLRTLTVPIAGAALFSLSACGSGSGEAADGSETYTFTLAAGVSQSHPAGEATQWWVDRVEELTDGQVQIKPTWSGALVPSTELLAGVKDGRADIALSSIAWIGAEMPYTGLTTVPFVAYNGDAAARALNNLYEENDDVRNEFEQQGVRLLSSQPLDVVLIGSPDGFHDIAGLEGTQLRAAGEWIGALKDVGAEPVNVPYAETYEAVQRGTIDGYALNWEGVSDLQLHEVAPVMEDPGLGQISNSLLLMNKSKWDSVPEDLQVLITQATEEHLDAIPEIYGAQSRTSCQDMVDAGASFVSWPEEETEAWKSQIGDSVLEEWKARTPDEAAAERAFEQYKEALKEFEEGSEWESGHSICESIATENG